MKSAGCSVVLSFLGLIAVLAPLAHATGLQARNIGGAFTSGRVVAIAVHPAEPHIIYIGAATGGVWKSRDAGTTWQPLFDRQDTSSIGAISIHPLDPKVIWVGTGEAKPRYGTGFGTGVFKSTDAGQSWTKIGLPDSERIQRIILHPQDLGIAWVAATGPAYRAGGERGVYKTTNGGQSWQRQLFTTADSGAADLALDPRNPQRLLAAMWDYRREPWFFRSGGRGSGLYLTEDGGANWRKLTAAAGIPAGTLGRIGVAFAPGAKAIAYATIESSAGNAFYRSENGGLNWRLTDQRPQVFGVRARPWYSQTIHVDPQNPDIVYLPNYDLFRSKSGGHDFESMASKSAHTDFHAVWINPRDSQHLIAVNDGGVSITHSGGQSWRAVTNLPIAQFYQVSVDRATPYSVYGNVQDSSDTRTPSGVLDDEFITNEHVQRLAGGEQGWVGVLPGQTRQVISNDYQGVFRLQDTLTGSIRTMQPNNPDANTALRFNVEGAFALDPRDSNTFYSGSQFLHRSTDQGQSWQIISPDLTTANPRKLQQWRSGGITWENYGGENYCTIYSISPSTQQAGVIWVGTDDGRIHLTRDSGAQWQDISIKHGAVPREAYVTDIELVRDAPAAAYVVLENFRQGDMAAYLYHTQDWGRRWSALPLQGVRGPVHVLTIDPLEPRLFFLGTEFGLYVSLDAGMNWRILDTQLPTVPVRDVVVHPDTHDLVIGTYGRGLWVIDDIRSLRAITQQPHLQHKAARILSISDGILWGVTTPRRSDAGGDTGFTGTNRPYGSWIDYVGPTDVTQKQALITVRDEKGAIVRELVGTADPGINRVVWDLKHGASARAWVWPNEWSELAGPQVPPGTYNLTVAIGAAKDNRDIKVLADPRAAGDLGVQQQRYALTLQILAALKKIEAIDEYTQHAQQQLTTALQHAALRSQVERTKNRLQLLSDALLHRMPQSGADIPEHVLNDTQALRSSFGLSRHLSYIYDFLQADKSGLSATNQRWASEALSRVTIAITALQTFFNTDWQQLSQQLQQRGLPPLTDGKAFNAIASEAQDAARSAQPLPTT